MSSAYLGNIRPARKAIKHCGRACKQLGVFFKLGDMVRWFFMQTSLDLVPRPSPAPVFDRLQCAKTEPAIKNWLAPPPTHELATPT